MIEFITKILIYDHLCLGGLLASVTCWMDLYNYISFLLLNSCTLFFLSNLILMASFASTNWSNSFVKSSFYALNTLIWLLRASISTCKFELLSNRAEFEYLAPSSSFLIYMTESSLCLIFISWSLIYEDKSMFLPAS